MNLLLMEGTGNRFFVLDAFREPLPSGEDLPSLVRSICRQENGSGADGLLIVAPAEGFAGRMRVYNADGSIAEMCGNGLRCVGKLLFDRGDAPEQFVVATDAGPRDVEVCSSSSAESELRVGLGQPIFDPSLIPTTLAGTPPVEQPIVVSGEIWQLTCVSMGNPHAVIFIHHPTATDVARIGRAIEHHEAFPKRTNVEFASVVSRTEIVLRVWERGVGETAACGTGAAATAVAAILTGRTDRSVSIRLQGGELKVSWPRNDAEVCLTGPAKLLDVIDWTLPAASGR
jgi:diaminopimelate epimerase